MEKERKAFDAWHLKQFKDINDDLNDDEAEHLYQRVYSHEAQDLIRQMEFNAWLSSANRQGYKLVPIEPTRDMLLQIETPSGFNFEIPCGYENIGVDADIARDIYKAMIGAIE